MFEDLRKAFRDGLVLFRDLQRERLTRAFTTDMAANFAVSGNPPPGGGAAITLQSAAPFLSNLQMIDLDPGEYTIQFSVLPTPTRVPAVNAEVIWKVNGQQLRRLISVYSGAAIGGVCEAVHVKLQDQSGVLDSLLLGDVYKVIGTLSRGTRPVIMQPPILMTLPAQLIETGVLNPIILGVPQDAGVVNVFFLVTENIGFAAPLDTDIQAFFVSQGGVILGGVYPLKEDDWVPLPPGTVTVQIRTNQAAPNNTFVQVIWGIEG
jgi:hypothetical protein